MKAELKGGSSLVRVDIFPNVTRFVRTNVRFTKKQPVIWRKLLERTANMNFQSRQELKTTQPARVPGGGEGTFEIMPDFFNLPDEFMEFFGGRDERP